MIDWKKPLKTIEGHKVEYLTKGNFAIHYDEKENTRVCVVRNVKNMNKTFGNPKDFYDKIVIYKENGELLDRAGCGLDLINTI